MLSSLEGTACIPQSTVGRVAFPLRLLVEAGGRGSGRRERERFISNTVLRSPLVSSILLPMLYCVFRVVFTRFSWHYFFVICSPGFVS